MANMLKVEIVAPNKRVFRGEAVAVWAPGVEGSFEVLYNHAPMIAAIEVGSLMVATPSGEKITFATSGGFVEVLNNVVTVLAETVEPASEIDLDRAKESEDRALQRLMESSTEAERKQAAEALERARNRARLAISRVGTERNV